MFASKPFAYQEVIHFPIFVSLEMSKVYSPFTVFVPSTPGVARPIRMIPVVPQNLQRRKGRKRLWTPLRFTAEQRERGAELMKEWGKKTTQRKRVLADYEEACALSGADPNDPASVEVVMGQMDLAALSVGSIGTYLSHVKSKYRLAATPAVYAAGVRCADAESKHAPDIEDDILWRYVVNAPTTRLQAVLYLEYICGFRSIAARWVKRRSVWLPAFNNPESEGPEIIVTIDKTRKKRSQKATIRLPHIWNIKPPPTWAVWCYIMHGNESDRLFPDMTASIINGALRTMSEQLGLPRPTTYSFRRGFINRIIPLVSSRKDLAKYTLHFTEETVEAFYRRSKKEQIRMAAV